MALFMENPPFACYVGILPYLVETVKEYVLFKSLNKMTKR